MGNHRPTIEDICVEEIKEILEQLKTDGELVKIIVPGRVSGNEFTGTIDEVNEGTVKLINVSGDEDTCYISLCCICAVCTVKDNGGNG